jgi:diaminopimelate epimerase
MITTVPSGPLSLDSRFFKGHGHGNDYLVFRQGSAWSVNPEAVGAVCHPHRGVGGDGIVALLTKAPEGGPHPRTESGFGKGPFRLRMFNPDGSEFERSGNGLRIFGAFLYDQGLVELGESFAVEVGGSTLEMQVTEKRADGTLDLSVEMGHAALGLPPASGRAVRPGSEDTVSLRLPEGDSLEVHPVNVGNPHCVVFRDELLDRDLIRLGPVLTSHRAFPGGTNVQLARVAGEGRIQILIWERGVGRTAASGTSACAATCAAVATGRLGPGRVRVEMEGGDFFVTVSGEMAVRLEGPVQSVFSGRLSPSFLRALEGSADRGQGSGPDPAEEEDSG